MSDERNDDEILGRALSRAIETQDVEETPYDRSSLMVHPLRRGVDLWQMLGAAAVILLAVAFGAWFTRPTEAPVVATSPTPVAFPSPSIQATSGPSGKPTPTGSPASQSVWVYFARDALPPLGTSVSASFDPTSAETRIMSRLAALHAVSTSTVPAGAANLLGTAGPGPANYVVAAKVDGDLVTLTFQFPQATRWNVKGDAQARELVQQIVYTATEEVGIRRVLIVEDGKANATIDQLVISKPLTRDDVSGYRVPADGSMSWRGDDSLPHVMPFVTSRDIQDGTLVRLTLEGRSQDGTKANLPSFTIGLAPNDGFPKTRDDGYPPKELMTIAFQWNGGGTSGGAAGVETVNRSPLRLFVANGPTFVLGLDDARPWRAYEPDPQHLVVEIGGEPRLVSDRIAVTAPTPDSTIDTRASRTFTLSGTARVFEANVVWRLVDASKKVIANGHTTASIGTSALWGTVSTQVTIPQGVTGTGFALEVYEVSPKDGSEQGVVSIPLAIR